jgi:drug/metabolite transporter (DMT)-like permease
MIRVVTAAAATWLFLPLIGRLGNTLAALGDRRAMLTVVGGTIAGPVIGIWLSMVALAGMQSGVAVALINLSPLVLVPIVYFAYGERPSWRTLLGTCIALAGVCLLVMT